MTGTGTTTQSVTELLYRCLLYTSAMVGVEGWRGVGLGYVATAALSSAAILLAARVPELRGRRLSRLSDGRA